MVAGVIAGNISAEATTPTGNTFVEAMRGAESRVALGFRPVLGIRIGDIQCVKTLILRLNANF